MGAGRLVARWWNRLAGHGWTVVPALRHDITGGRSAPEAVRWETTIEDPTRAGAVTLSGLYRAEPGARALVVVLHGLGGNVTRSYCVTAAQAVAAEGLSCLRLSMRGADDVGNDIHHAGLISDVGAVLRDPAFAHYEDIYLLGYSLGGHVALRAAVDPVSERLRGVVAICPPVDLLAVQRALDSRRSMIYRHYILKGLKEMYRGVAARGEVPTPVERVDQVKTLREWDRVTVVPRFGYASVDDYYQRESVANCIDRLKIPALVVASPDDPMIPAGALFQLLRNAPACLEVKWVPGGHVFFSAKTVLGLDAERLAGGVERQVVRWLGGWRS